MNSSGKSLPPEDEDHGSIEEALEIFRSLGYIRDDESSQETIDKPTNEQGDDKSTDGDSQPAQTVLNRYDHVLSLMSEARNPVYHEWSGQEDRRIDPQKLFAFIRHTQMIKVSERGVHIFEDGRWQVLDKRRLLAKIKDYVPVSLRNKDIILDVLFEFNSEAPDIQEDEWDSQEIIVNCQNGIYHVGSKALLPHSPEYLSRNQLKFNYISECKIEDTSVFSKMLEDYFDEDLDTRDFVLDAMAYILSNFRGSRIKGIIFLCGESGSGKTQIRQLLISLLGRELSATVDIKRMGQQFGTSVLDGCRLAGHGDVSAIAEADFSILKTLTGSDDAPFERKYKNLSTINFRGVFLYVANSMPPVKGDRGRAVYDRLYVVPMNRVIPPNQRDTGFLDKLLTEKDLIGSILLDRLNDIAKRGYTLIPSSAMLEARKAYEESNNSILKFVQECCILFDGKTKCSRFHEIYSKWCKLNRFRTERLSDLKNLLLSEFGIGGKKTDGGYDWYDLSIRPEKSAEIIELYESYRNS